MYSRQLYQLLHVLSDSSSVRVIVARADTRILNRNAPISDFGHMGSGYGASLSTDMCVVPSIPSHEAGLTIRH
jgi:hypothetical protein